MLSSKSTLPILLLNLVIGSIVFYMIGIRHTSISFHSDDYGFIYNGRYNSIHDIKRIFKNGDMISNANSLHDQKISIEKPSFLETLYRPLVLIIMGTEYKFFGLNAYRYHLVHALLHTLVTILIFNLIALLVHPLAGIPTSLFFGLHSSLKDYFFWQCYIQNSLEGCLTLLIIIFFIWWRRSKKLLPLTTCLGLFFITLLLRETIIVLPLLAGLWVLVEKNNQIFFLRLKNAFNTCLLFVIPTATYLLLRLWAHPFSSKVQNLGIKHFPQQSSSLWFNIKNKFFDLLTCFFDILGLKWLPSGTMLFKIATAGILCFFIFYTWHKNPYKYLLLLTATATILTSWPSLLLVHCSRYTYQPIAFFALFIGLLTASLTRRSLIFFCLLGTIYTAIQGYITNKNLTAWAYETNIEKNILRSAAHLSSSSKNIIVLGYPLRLIGTGSLAGLRLHGASKDATVNFTLPYYNAWEKGITKPISFSRSNNEIIATSQTPKTVWFAENCLETLKNQGTATAKTSLNGNITKVSFVPNQSNTLFTYWDGNERKIKLIDEMPK